jgi:hypothetical protein
VDKWDFFHKLKGLREPEAVAQTLFLDGIETGQKIDGRVGQRFRTFNPVDIQQFVHKAGRVERFLSRSRWFLRVLVASLVDVEPVLNRGHVRSRTFFFDGGKQGRSTSPA